MVACLIIVSLQVLSFENLTLNFELLSSDLDLDYGLDTGPWPWPWPGPWTGPGAWQHFWWQKFIIYVYWNKYWIHIYKRHFCHQKCSMFKIRLNLQTEVHLCLKDQVLQAWFTSTRCFWSFSILEDLHWSNQYYWKTLNMTHLSWSWSHFCTISPPPQVAHKIWIDFILKEVCYKLTVSLSWNQ